MEKFIIDERTGWEYELKGDIYYPTERISKNSNLTPAEPPEDDETEEKPIGVWGMRHKAFIKENRRAFYNIKTANGTLFHYLAEIDRQVEEMFSRLVNELAEKENVTEQLKADDQMLWVQMMNNIWERAMEIVNAELIFT